MSLRRKQLIAVIDLGSNSIRLVIYDRLARAPVSRFNERRLCGVGREVARSGRLGSAGQACPRAALQRFVAIARTAGCRQIDIVATAAFRTAVDGPDFLQAMRDELGVEIALLSGAEEATFAALGVATGFHAPRGLVGDLGGGSVEFGVVPLGNPRLAAPVSLPIGGLVLADAMRDGIEAARSLIDRTLGSAPELAGAARDGTFFAVGGSWRALARARMAILEHPLRVVHGYELTAAEAIKLGQAMSRVDPRELARMPGFPKRRTDTVQGAALLLAEAVAHLQPERVVFSATGLREGRLFARLEAAEQARDPLLAGAEELGRTTNREPDIGAALVRFTDRVFAGASDQEARLRAAACHVADTSWREHPETRAREAFLRLVQYPFLGISHAERVLLAHAVFVRYEGQRDDPLVRRTLQLAAPPALEKTVALGLVLDLALRLSAGLPAILERCRLTIAGTSLRLQAGHPAALVDDVSIRGRLRAAATGLGLARHEVLPAMLDGPLPTT